MRTSATRPTAAARPAARAKLLERGNLLAAACPSREVLMHMTSRWGVLVLLVLETGTLRFGELRRAIGGVSERMLAQTLQWLQNDGLVDREARDGAGPHVEYRLSPLGVVAAGHVRQMADWIEESLPQILAERTRRAAVPPSRGMTRRR